MATVKHRLARPLYPFANLIIFLCRWFAIPRTACRQWFTTGVTIFGRNQLLTPLKNADIEYEKLWKVKNEESTRNLSSILDSQFCTNRCGLHYANRKHPIKMNAFVGVAHFMFSLRHFVFFCRLFWYFNIARPFGRFISLIKSALLCAFYIDHILAFPHVCVPILCPGWYPVSCGLDSSSFHKCRHKSSYRSHGYGVSSIRPASMQLLLSLRCSQVCAWSAD